MKKIVVVSLVMIGVIGAARAQNIDPLPQRAQIIAVLSQDLARAEAAAQALQAQLSQEQKKVSELKAKCGEPCKELPAQ